MLGIIICVVDGLLLETRDRKVLGYFEGFIDGTMVGKFEGLLL